MGTPVAARTALLLLFAVSSASSLPAQSPGAAEDNSPGWELPTRPKQWINFPPLSADALLGKGVVLVFFEEQCPSCAKRWPEHQATAAKYADKPVVFLAVNSGNPPGPVQQYTRRHKVTWPVVVDFDRSFEASVLSDQPSGGRPQPVITLQNIQQIRTVSASGQLSEGRANDLAQAAEKALEGAEWRVDPAAIPPELQKARFYVEFGAFARAARDIEKAGKREGPLKAGAEALLAAVKESLQEDRLAAKQAYDRGEVWQAYKGLAAMGDKYDGYKPHGAIIEKLKGLKNHDAVKDELRAQRTLDKALAAAMKGGSSVRRAVSQLERLVSDRPGTEAADRAQAILAQHAASR